LVYTVLVEKLGEGEEGAGLVGEGGFGAGVEVF